MTDLREIPFASVCNRSNLGIFFASSPIIFQAGYFSEIGIEYLSFMSIGQAIVNSLLIAPVIPVILWIAAYTWEGILDRVRSGETPSDYKLLRYWNFVERPKTLFIIIYLILLISYAENYLDLGNYRVSSKVSEFIFFSVYGKRLDNCCLASFPSETSRRYRWSCLQEKCRSASAFTTYSYLLFWQYLR